MISDPRPMRPSLVSCQRSQNTRLPSLQYMVVLGLIVVLIGAFMEVIKDKGFRPQYDQSLVVMLTQVIIDHYII